MTLSFFVNGIPRPAGSKRAFIRPGARFPTVLDMSGEKGNDWRGDVKTFALAAIKDSDWPIVTTLPVRVRFAFTFPRPKSHYKTGKNAHLLRDDAPTCHTTKPDALKLARAVEDALTGIVWKDDAQICAELLTKEYGDKPGCEIVIETIETAKPAKAKTEFVPLSEQERLAI